MGISLVPAFVGAALNLAGLAGLYKSRASAHWTLVAGTIVEVSIEERRRVFRTDPAIVYSATLHYRYVFKRLPYRGTRQLGGRVTGRANAVKFGAAYLPGQPIDVFVDERRPHRHTLFRNGYRQWWWLVGFGLCWLALALWTE